MGFDILPMQEIRQCASHDDIDGSPKPHPNSEGQSQDPAYATDSHSDVDVLPDFLFVTPELPGMAPTRDIRPVI